MRAINQHILFGVTLLVLPLSYWEGAIDPMLVPSFCALALGLLIAAMLLIAEQLREPGSLRFSKWESPVVIAYLLYWILVGASLIQATNISEALFEWARVSIVGLLLLVSVMAATNCRNALSRFVKYAVAACLLLSIIGLGQHFGWAFSGFVQHGIPAGTFANRGLFISYLTLLIPIVVLGAMTLRRFWQVASATAAILALLLVIIAENRSSWVSLISGAAVVAVVTLWKFSNGVQVSSHSEHRGRYLRTSIGGAAILLVLAGGIIISGNRDSFVARAKSIVDLQDASIRERLLCWEKTAQMAWDNPIVGVGAGNCKIIFPSYGIQGTQQESGDIFFQRPHNDYLWVLSELGIFGLLAYLAFLGFALKLAFTIMKSPKNRGEGQFALAAVAVLICFMTDSMFSFPKERITHLAIVMVIIALLLSLEPSRTENRHPSSRGFVLGSLFGVALITIPLLLLGYARLKSEVHTKAALVAREIGDWRTVIRESSEARTYFATLDPTSTPLAWYRGVGHYSLGDLESASEDFKLAYRDNPNHIHVMNNLATCYELSGEHVQAEVLYRRLLRIHPSFLEARLNLAATLFNAGQFREAETVLSAVDSHEADAKLIEFREKIAEALRKEK